MWIKDKIKRLSDERWNVGIINNSLDSIMRGEEVNVSWIKSKYKDSWFADPFILDVTDEEIILLVEEFYKPNYRGRISKLRIGRKDLLIKSIEVVLELPTHLSFPVIIRQDSNFGKKLNQIFNIESDKDFVYLLPENGESGALTLYKYWESSNKIQPQGVVLREAVEDAVPVTINNETYLFCTPRPNPNGKDLHIYLWEQNKKEFRFLNSCHFKENIARMAGMFFKYNDKIVRPTQECNCQYGHAITLENINFSEEISKELDCKEIRRIYSTNPKLNVGTHTFNMYKGVIITDSLGFDNLWIRKLLKMLHLLR